MSYNQIQTYEENWDYYDQFRPKFVKDKFPTIPEIFHVSAEAYPDKVAFKQHTPEDISFTYKQAEDEVARIANWLVNEGVKHGDKVGLTGKNSIYWALAYLAGSEIGATMVPIDYQLEIDNIVKLMDFAGVKVAFADKEKYDELKNSKSSIKNWVSLAPEKDNYIMDIKAKKEKAYTSPVMNDLAAILFTSGTTGNEKGVMLRHESFSSDALQAGNRMFLRGAYEDVWYALLPLHHSYCFTAVFLESMLHGSTCIFAPGLSVGQMMKDLNQGKVTMVMGIPLLYNKILKGLMKQVRSKGLFVHIFVGAMMRWSGLLKKLFNVNVGKKIFKSLLQKANLYQVKYLICGAGPLAPETFLRYQQLGLDFVQGYGMTETSPISTLNPTFHFKIKSVGKKFPFIDMKILHPDSDGIGEIAIKGNICCEGYYKNEEATNELFTEDGFLKTGDLGYMDKEDYLYLTGRAKSLIVTEGGKNVFPEEIEDHFQLFQEIEQVLVKGYIADAKNKIEGIEAVFYPNEEHYKEQGVFNSDRVKQDIIHAVKVVNKELMAYKKITRVRIIDKPMEMTTTKKIKRPLVTRMLNDMKENPAFDLN